MIPVGTTVRVIDPGYGRITGQMGTVVSHHEEFGLMWNDVSIQMAMWYFGDSQLERMGPYHREYMCSRMTEDGHESEQYNTLDGFVWVRKP